MTVRCQSPKWLLLVSLNLVTLFLSEVILLAAGHSNSVMPPYSSLSTKEALQRRLLKGREVIPPMSSNAIPGEPSCDQLRAMWRYYKRQSRAELTNEIPRFGSNLFWDILPVAPQQPHISSFAPIKGRSKQRLRLKTAKSPAYGRMVYKQEKDRSRKPPRPMEQVAQLMGKTPKEKVEGSVVPEAIVHLSPPPTPVPTKPSSLQQIKEVFREERIREKGPAMRNNEDNGGKSFGRIILSPPRGMDGRVANKPRELMTPFEKIRFGHADDILDEGTRPNMNLMAKRRAVPLPVLKSLHQQQQLHLSLSQYVVPRHSRDNPNQFEDHWTFPVSDSALDETYNTLDRSQFNDGQGRDPTQEFSIDGNGWASFPLTADQDDNNNKFRMKNPPGNFAVVEMQPYQPLKTFSSQPVPEMPISMDSPTCSEVEGQLCRVNSDCACIGFGLYRCYINQCQVMSFAPPADVISDPTTDSIWHSDPVPKNKLGLWESVSDDSLDVNGDPVANQVDYATFSNKEFQNGKNSRQQSSDSNLPLSITSGKSSEDKERIATE